MCLHIPFSKQGLKGLQAIAQDEETLSRLTERFQEAIVYNKVVGNIYTGSIFLSLLSLLENSRALETGNQILFIAMVVALSVKFSAVNSLKVIATTYKKIV